MAERAVFTVSELTARIKRQVEDAFPAIWVEGEISNLRAPSSGHAYFTLKDDLAQLRCVLFRGRGRRVRFALEDGLQVLVFGGLDVYAARGEYQLVVELMEPKGLGALQLAFEQLKRKLEAEGLFDPGRKRPLPTFPEPSASSPRPPAPPSATCFTSSVAASAACACSSRPFASRARGRPRRSSTPSAIWTRWRVST